MESHIQDIDNCKEYHNEYVKDILSKIEDHKKKNGPNYDWSLDDFEIGRPIGKGQYGRVYLAREKTTQYIVALKVIFLSHIKKLESEEQVLREIEINIRLEHPNLIKLLTYFRDEKRIFYVLEYAGGGDLYKYLKSQPKGRLTEHLTAKFISQIADVLEYCHKNKVIHRDIKPENILLTEDLNIKVADFGWAVHTVINKRETLCGTIDYLPPEMLQNKSYDEKVDIWCLGVLCYELLVGKPPFNNPNQQITFRKIKRVDMKYPSYVSFQAKNFIFSLLKLDPKERMPLSEAKKHTWIKQMKLKTFNTK